MKKAALVAVSLAVVLCAYGAGSAQQEQMNKSDPKQARPAPRGGFGQRNPWYTKIGLIRGMQPTEDGGIVVMVADKMIKYDKDLNKVKEVTIELPDLPEPFPAGGNCASGGSCGKSSSEDPAKE